jgi:hypothetical protein
MVTCMSFDPEQLQFKISHGGAGWMLSRLHGLYLGTPSEHLRLVMQMPQLQAFTDVMSSVSADLYGFGEQWHSLHLPKFVDLSDGV